MRRTLGVALCAVFFLVACGSSEAGPKSGLTRTERSVVAKAHVDPAMAVRVRALGTSIERLKGRTPDYDEYAADGIVLNTQPQNGRAVLRKVRQQLDPTEYDAYLLEETYGTGPDQIAVLDADDHEYLAIVRTDAANFDMDHEAVMDRYLQWEKLYDLKLRGAGLDWMEAEIGNPPPDWLAFAKEVYTFCPDIVDQGVGDVEALAKEMERSRTLYLWWD